MTVTELKSKAQQELDFLNKERDEIYIKLKVVRSQFELDKLNSMLSYVVWRYELLGY